MSNDIEPKGASQNVVGASSCKPIRGSGLGALKRELTPKDLNDAGAKKMLLNLVDSLESENAELKSKIVDYYKKDKALAVLQARYEGLLQNVTLKGVFFSLGWTLVGFIPFIHEKKWGWGIITVAIIVAAGLIIVPVKVVGSTVNKGGHKDET